MSRKRYLMLSKQHYMDMDSRVIVTKSERHNPNNTYIPKFLWSNNISPKLATGFEMKNGKLVDTFSNNLETNVIELYGIRVTFYDEFSADISFYDSRKKQRHQVEIRGTAKFLTRTVNKNRTDKILMSVDLLMSFDGVSRNFISNISDRNAFKPIGYLGQRCIETTSKSNSLFFSYGMINNDYKVEYLGKELEGSCYILMFGLWAIILRDNLSFDALVTIKGCNRDRIIIDKFIYTSNVYLIKIISLWK